MKKVYLAIIAMLMLAGCAKTMFTKPGGTPQQFATDKANCISQAQMSTAGANNPFMIPMLTKQCLRGKGYIAVKR